MTMRKSTFSMMLAASVLAGTATSASAQDASGQAAYRDIEQTLGSVPTFFKMFPETGIAGAWAEFKSVQLNPKTALNGKTKELIGLAVAAQVPCHYCIYFHTAAAKLNGATDAEIREAVAMAAITRHWSTVLRHAGRSRRLQAGNRHGPAPGRRKSESRRQVAIAIRRAGRPALARRAGRRAATSTHIAASCSSHVTADKGGHHADQDR
jgi:AhpD family alkylhydroperoxidase